MVVGVNTFGKMPRTDFQGKKAKKSLDIFRVFPY